MSQNALVPRRFSAFLRWLLFPAAAIFGSGPDQNPKFDL
jgi:hypothetical protein